MAYTFKHGDRILDGYTVQRAVGRGGFGEVYYAISDGGREVALKYLRDNPEIELRGVNICMNLKSPHLVTIFDVRKAFDGNYVIIMEYISGPSLRDLLIAEPNGFSPEKAAFFVREIAKGLGYLHDRGIVHRDLKPGNIFYDDGYVKIGDYGLSKFISVSRHSAQTASVGTVHYMAPEIGSGDYSRGIDVYALGVMTYEMLKGRVPFEGSSMAEVLMKHLTSQPELDQLPRPFGHVIRKALEKDPRNRYQTVSEMVDDLLAGEEIQRSLAGFSVQSLPGAVARAGGGAGSASPMPSPNPVPRAAPFGPAMPRGGTPSEMPLPKRVAKQQDRYEKKFERKMARLQKDTHGAAAPPPSPHSGDTPEANATRAERRKRMALSAFLAVALSVGLGIVFGNATDIGFAAGMAAALLVPTMTLGIGLARAATVWFAADTGPGWAGKLVRAGCCAPLLALGNLPLFVDSPYGASAVAVWLSLVIVCVLRNWDKLLDRAVTGEMSFGSAVGSGIYAVIAFFIVSAAMDREPREELVALAGAVAGVASLIIQASSWWRLGAAVYARATGSADDVAAASQPPPGHPFHGAIGGDDRRFAPGGGDERSWDPSVTQTIGAGSRSHVPFAIPVGPATVGPMSDRSGGAFAPVPTGGDRADSSVDALAQSFRAVRIRGFAMRGFWSLITLALLGGVIATGIVAATLGDEPREDQTGVLVGCVACAAMMLYALRKTAPIRHAGFWREHVRTLVRSLALFGVGANLLVITRHWESMADAPRVLSGIGLFCSSIVFALVTLPRRSPASIGAPPFWRAADNSGNPAIAQPDFGGADKPARG